MRAPVDSSEPTSTCTSTGQQDVAHHPWSMAIMFGLSSVHRGQVVPADIRPGPVSKSGLIQNCCGAGRGLREPPGSTLLAHEEEKVQCENRFRPRKKKRPAVKTGVPIEHKRKEKLCLHTGSNTSQNKLSNSYTPLCYSRVLSRPYSHSIWNGSPTT